MGVTASKFEQEPDTSGYSSIQNFFPATDKATYESQAFCEKPSIDIFAKKRISNFFELPCTSTTSERKVPSATVTCESNLSNEANSHVSNNCGSNSIAGNNMEESVSVYIQYSVV